ncbi:uncharacterized protein LOC129725051 [Wyeomyia smithii]|uniref:uncharacterized protein LOC129725051 n=1 Tax=Wyeomyia smithii TaxID=174621 RepID=UPI002467BFC7|nr:uncharacterized protein LOC129725051 [Wyeomyia smithii]
MASSGRAIEKSKRNSLTLEQKAQIVQLLKERKHSKSDLAKCFNVDRSTIRKIEIRQQQILQTVSTGSMSESFSQRKYVTTGKYSNLEQILYDWYTYMSDQQGIVSTNELLAKAKELASALNIGENFKCSERWVRNFKKRFALCPTNSDANKNHLKDGTSGSFAYSIDANSAFHPLHYENSDDEFAEDNKINIEEVSLGEGVNRPNSSERNEKVIENLTFVIEWAEENQIEFKHILSLKEILALAEKKHCS